VERMGEKGLKGKALGNGVARAPRTDIPPLPCFDLRGTCGRIIYKGRFSRKESASLSQGLIAGRGKTSWGRGPSPLATETSAFLQRRERNSLMGAGVKGEH